jgi:hypothetical protein
MRFRMLPVLAAGLVLALTATAQDTNPATPQGGDAQGGGRREGRGEGRSWGGGMMGGFRGVMGTVTEEGADHFTIKNEAGEIYTVHIGANTRIFKQPAQRQAQNGERTPPQAIKPTDIKVGDAIAANGDVDAGAKSVGAVMVVQLDPDRARQMREMQANFGKTWLVGRVIAVHDVKIVLQSPVDNAPHTFVADENTTFRKRREPITLADVQTGDNVRVEGSVKEGIFMAATVSVMGMPPANGGPAQRNGPPPQ